MDEDPTTPQGTPEDYRDFVRQMEAAAEQENAAARARQWRHVDTETRARIGADLINMSSRLARQNGFEKSPLRYPKLPNVSRTA